MNSSSSEPVADRRARRTILLMVAICAAPVIASYAAYYLWPRDTRINYGKLIATSAPALPELASNGRSFHLEDLRGRWVMLWSGRAPCAGLCAKAVYATRQARTMQNTEQDRVARLWIVSGPGNPDPALLTEHPGLVVASAPEDPLASWPEGDSAIYLVDPLGNLVLAWPGDPDIKKLAKDLDRLLRASRVG